MKVWWNLKQVEKHSPEQHLTRSVEMSSLAQHLTKYQCLETGHQASVISTSHRGSLKICLQLCECYSFSKKSRSPGDSNSNKHTLKFWICCNLIDADDKHSNPNSNLFTQLSSSEPPLDYWDNQYMVLTKKIKFRYQPSVSWYSKHYLGLIL